MRIRHAVPTSWSCACVRVTRINPPKKRKTGTAGRAIAYPGNAPASPALPCPPQKKKERKKNGKSGSWGFSGWQGKAARHFGANTIYTLGLASFRFGSLPWPKSRGQKRGKQGKSKDRPLNTRPLTPLKYCLLFGEQKELI